MSATPRRRRPKRFIRVPAIGFAALLAVLALPAAASAAWPIGGSLVSGNSQPGTAVQSSSAVRSVSVSADGKYAVFASDAGNLSAAAPNGGVFRKNLQNDSAPLEVVAKKQLVGGVACGVGQDISISGNGRYVAFDSGLNGLVPGDTNDRRDVFVRDMNVAIDAAGAHEIVSAPDGSSSGATYELVNGADGDAIPAAESCLYGTKLSSSGTRQISDDGTRVAYINNAFTNLAADSGNTTAPGQVFVRDTSDDSTTLISRVTRDRDWDVPGVTVPDADVGDPLPNSELFDTGNEKDSFPQPLVALSGDGSAVAWIGPGALVQADFTLGEGVNSDQLNGMQGKQLLWTKVDAGISTAARRVSGWVDIDHPSCSLNDFNFPASDFEPGDPCAGPFGTDLQSFLSSISISTDGNSVAFISSDGLRTETARQLNAVDAYISDMSSGVSRKSGLDAVTLSSFSAPVLRLNSAQISGDGRRMVITTTRRTFSATQPGLTEIGAFPTSTTHIAAFVIEANTGEPVSEGTIEWVGRGSGTDLSNPIGYAGLDADGDTLVLLSSAVEIYGGTGTTIQAICVRRGGSPCIPASGGSTDTVPPTITINAPANNFSTEAASVVVNYTVSDNEDSSPSCNFASGSSRPLSPGNNLLTVECSDDAGNVGSASVTVVRTTPVTPTPPPPTPPTVQPATITASAAKPLANGTAKVPVKTSGAGTVVATGTAKVLKGKKLKSGPAGSASAAVGADGAASINFKLNSAAKKTLKAKKKLSVTLKIVFTDSNGQTAMSTVKLNFKAKKK